MRTTRRRARLNSTRSASGYLGSRAALVVLVLGLVVGLGLGLRNRGSGQTASLESHYLLLASDLYAQGEPLASVRDRLLAVGYTDPSVAVLGAADLLAQSSDSISQQEADQLHQFADALASTSASPTGVPTTSATQTVAASAAGDNSTPTAGPEGSATPEASASPAPTLVDEAATSTSVPEVVPPLPPTPAPPPPSPTPQPTAAPAKSGTVHGSVVLRAGASSKTASLGVIPNGAKVTVYGSLDGQALAPPEATWYHVVYNGKSGYLYANQVLVGR